jgi:hypothetical protein
LTHPALDDKKPASSSISLSKLSLDQSSGVTDDKHKPSSAKKASKTAKATEKHTSQFPSKDV